jgi:hypothetical protein
MKEKLYRKAYRTLEKLERSGEIGIEKSRAIRSIIFLEELLGEFSAPTSPEVLIRKDIEELYRILNFHLKEYFNRDKRWCDDPILQNFLPLPHDKLHYFYNGIYYLHKVHERFVKSVEREKLADLLAGLVFYVYGPYPPCSPSFIKEFIEECEKETE